jgi:DNA polymerase-1
MRSTFSEFREIWLVDFEFQSFDGERPQPICFVAHELRSRQILKVWQDDLRRLSKPPYSVGRDSLFVAYYASAEMGCHLALGWPMPRYVLDLFTEFRALTNGLRTISGNGLLGALAYFGIEAMDAAEKDEMRALALRGGPWSAQERAALLEYCESDVIALKNLLGATGSRIDFPRGLLRGRFMKAAASIEWTGVPINIDALGKLRENWPKIQNRLIERVDRNYGVFVGRTFKADRFEQWLGVQSIPWPRLPSGRLALDDDTFREMARQYPVVNQLRELRFSLSQLRLESLAVGRDGRNRTMLSAFQSKTGRNQPSNSKFIFGPAVWLRNLIQPKPGYGVAYVDWSQQEFGIAAALSGDPAMLDAYLSGDPYLAFAKQAGAVPEDATKHTHATVREQYKAAALGTQYGMEAESLALHLRKSVIEARELLQDHRRIYKKFWKWSEAAVSHAMLFRNLFTVFGWRIYVGFGSDNNPRSLRNFPMQANGAEMLRLACCLSTERGVSVCAPVHDAILIEAPLDRLEKDAALTQEAMREASAAVLGGFELRSDAKLVRWPEHYTDERGEAMWTLVWGLVEEAIQNSNRR